MRLVPAPPTTRDGVVMLTRSHGDTRHATAQALPWDATIDWYLLRRGDGYQWELPRNVDADSKVVGYASACGTPEATYWARVTAQHRAKKRAASALYRGAIPLVMLRERRANACTLAAFDRVGADTSALDYCPTRGTYTSSIVRAMGEAGAEFMPNVVTVLDVPKEGVFLVSQSYHTYAVIDGVIHSTTRRRCTGAVQYCWKIA